MTDISFERLHASTVAIDGRAVMITGKSGSGKSDLALRLIDRGAALISDDYTLVQRVGAQLFASPPETIRGKMEVRGVGVITKPALENIPVGLIVDLDLPAIRFPDPMEMRLIVGILVPAISLVGFEASTPIKIELALGGLAKS